MRKSCKPLVPPKRASWVGSVLAIAVLLGSAGLVTGGVWLSIQMFINPDAVVWMNQLLPQWAQIPLLNREPPQTLTQIAANLSPLGKTLGEPLPVEPTAQTLLLPVLAPQPNCQVDCEQIVELRVYQFSSIGKLGVQNGEPYYQLVSQVPVEGLEESLAIAPLVDQGDADYRGSNRPLPLTQLHRFEVTTPAPGFWFYLSGQHLQGSTAIAYGYIVHYNPSRFHLSLMLPWTSPKGQIPQWQVATAGGSPKLVVDQTIDLEPQLRVYQVKPTQFFLNPLQLEPLSLAEPALNSPAYRNAILIARSGLWSPAWEWLQFIKQQRQKNREPWSAAAQAQTDLIELYAHLTKTQAEKTWASPSQQVLAELIDGRWGEGLQVFQASAENTQEIATLLKTDSGRLWHRVEAALRVNPERPEVKAWGFLILAAQRGQQSAIAWLKQQPQNTPDTLAYIQSLLKRLNGSSTAHSSHIVGSAEPVIQVNASQWLQPSPKAALQLDEKRVWYQIQVAAFYDGKRWQRAPFSNQALPKTTSLWHQLGLDTDPKIQIKVLPPNGHQQITVATVKAIQLHLGILRVLAASETMATVNTAEGSAP